MVIEQAYDEAKVSVLHCCMTQMGISLPLANSIANVLLKNKRKSETSLLGLPDDNTQAYGW